MSTIRKLGRAIFAAAAALGAAGAAQAETWWFVGAGGNSLMLADADSIATGTETRTVAVRSYRLGEGEPQIGGAQVEVDCAGNRIRYLRLSSLTPTLAVAFEGQATGAAHDWRQLTDAHTGILLVRFVCGGGPGAAPAAIRVGTVAGRAGDRGAVARLIAAGVEPGLAAQFALGRPSPGQAAELLQVAPASAAAAIRREGLAQ